MHHESTRLNRYAIATLQIFRAQAIAARLQGDGESAERFEAAIASLLEPEAPPVERAPASARLAS